MTDTRPESTAASDGSSSAAARQPVPAVLGAIGSGDHRTIGRFLLGFSALFLLLTVVLGGLLSAEGVTADDLDVLGLDTYAQVFSLYRVGLVFLVVLPMFLGLACAIVPLQVGARTLAFARAAAAGFWGWLIGSVLVLAGYLGNGGFQGGGQKAVEVSFLGLGMVIVSLLLLTVCVLTTIVGLRSTGMTLARVPTFTWSMLLAGSIWLLSLPVAFANVVLLFLGQRYGGSTDFGIPEGQWSQVAWLVTQPQVYAFAIPAFGIVMEVVPVFAGRRQANYAVVLSTIGVFAALSFGAWAQWWLDPSIVQDALFVSVGMITLLPVLALLAASADTLRHGGARLTSPLLWALVSLLLILAAVLAGVVHVIDDLDLWGTTWGSAIMDYVLLGAVGAALTGVHYWSSKIFGRSLNEGIGRATALLFGLGVAVYALPQLIAGALDQRSVPLAQDVRDGVEALNAVSIAGAAIVLVALLVVGLNVARLRSAPAADADPWNGHTLEWATASPPLPGNFADVPAVSSERPLLDAREASA